MRMWEKKALLKEIQGRIISPVRKRVITSLVTQIYYVSFSRSRGNASYRMSALWIHLVQKYPLFMSPVCSSSGKTAQTCSEPHQPQLTQRARGEEWRS